MKTLSRADILAAADAKTKTLKVPEWGGSLTIKTWTVAEADAVGKLITEGMEAGYIENYRETIVQKSIVTETGDLMFTIEDIDALSAKSPAAMNRIFKAALALNKLDEEPETGN